MNLVRLAALSAVLAVTLLAACRSSSESTKAAPIDNGAASAIPVASAGVDAGHAVGGGPLATAPASAETKALLAKIQGYKKWPKFPENAQPAFSKQHDKMWVLAYYNDVVGRAIQARTLPLPDGAIIVKDNMASADAPEPTVLTTMSKQGGHWYWAETTPNGNVVVLDGKPAEGFRVAECSNCHAQAADNDQVYTHEFK